MGLVWTIIIGLVAGALAKFAMPGKDPGGLVITALLGIGGALLATFLGKALHWYEPGQSAGLIGATLGAILILVIYRQIKRRA